MSLEHRSGYLREILSLPAIYRQIIIEDMEKQQIVGTGRLMLERKLTRNCGLCGHIEDVVVDTQYRGQSLGKRVISALLQIAEEAGCYKVILDCSEDNVGFYEKCGLHRKEVQMAKYLAPST